SLAASKRIFEIHDKLKKGEEWGTLCKQFSEDAKTKEKEGELRWFSAGTLTTELNEAAFLLQKAGDYSAPVKSPFGWHIIKLLEKKELEPFEALKNTLKQKVSKDSRSELNRNYLIGKLKTKYNFKEQKKAKQVMQLWADSTVLKNNWAYNRQAKQLPTPLFSIEQNSYTLANFGEFLEKQTKPKEVVSPQLYVAQQYDEFVNKTIFDYHDSHLEENMPEFRYLFNEYYEGMLMFKIMEQNVWTKALTDTAGLQQYFTQHQDKYRWKERAKATLYNCDSQETLSTVQQELQKDWFVNQAIAFTPTSFLPNKADLDSTTKATLNRVAEYLSREKETLIELQVFSRKGEKNDVNTQRLAAIKNYLMKEKGIGAERIADKNLGKVEDAKLGGAKYVVYTKSAKTLIYSLTRLKPLAVQMIEGTFQRGDNAAMDAIEKWQTGKSSLQKDGRYYFVVIEEVLPASNKKLAETKGTVVSDYQAYLETAWLKYLTEKYPVMLHEETIKKFLKQ
ncbi:MAG: peptidylprolyl isomerase, partial [Thermoflexibacteraceae bacterium]